MAPIDILIEDAGTFDSDATSALARAFADVCKALEIPPNDDHGREMIAVRIIELARSGMLDTTALRDRTLRESGSAA